MPRQKGEGTRATRHAYADISKRLSRALALKALDQRMASAAATSIDGSSQNTESGPSSHSVSSANHDSGRGDPHDRYKSVDEVDLGVSQPDDRKGQVKSEQA